MLLPLVMGLLGAPSSTPIVRGDDLTDAKDKQAQLAKEVAKQKEQVKELNALQRGLATEISNTRKQLAGINADLNAVRKKITKMGKAIDKVKVKYNDLVVELAAMDEQLVVITGQEVVKKQELRERQALLAERIRSAYDTDRTSLLESFLSGGTFTDLLTEMSAFIDVGEQDKALAQQIAHDQEALAALHQNVADTRDRTNVLRQQTADQKRSLDASLKALKAAKAELRKLEKETQRNLSIQRATFAKIARNKADAAKALKVAAAAQRQLAAKISEIVRRQTRAGRIPSEYNGTLEWPMSGNVTQNFGCTGFSWEPPQGDCPHFHSGIDIVAPQGTKVRASGAGVVAYIGWNYADGAAPAWIVIIAPSENLQTWYAHMKPAYPGGIKAGSRVKSGQVVGYEGNTGHSTGAHLHWAVRFKGNFVNPRLFL
ncbi:MAG: peptidoglycan DD-metalloendopeptidase family protein [Chloroflexota bacterium]|nr:peptidoglycan DD-metalloendopeptidase family protein [Chloroflexota bacterium]